METLEISRDGGEGNDILPPQSKKQSIQRLYFCTAIFNLDLKEICSLLKPICKKFICGKEKCPTTDKIHYQTFVVLNKKKRATELGKIIPARWIPCDGNEEQNIKYCSKDAEIYKYGFPAEIELINELPEWSQKIFDVISQKPDYRKIYWFWSEKGNMYKSALTKYLVVKYNAIPAVSGKYADIINLIFNSDLDQKNIVVFDLPRNHGNNVSYSAIESIKNGLVVNTKYETGYKVFNAPHIFIFSNSYPDCDKLSEDRWEITKIE